MLGNASYPTYQAFLALGIAALITIVLMPLWIKILKYESIGQQVRADGPKRHLVKQGTPTMGGVVILIAIVLTCLIMAKHTTEMLLVLIATVATGVLAWLDAARQDVWPYSDLHHLLLGCRQFLRSSRRGAFPGRFCHRSFRPLYDV